MREWEIFRLGDLNVLRREASPSWWQGRLNQCLRGAFWRLTDEVLLGVKT